MRLRLGEHGRSDPIETRLDLQPHEPSRKGCELIPRASQKRVGGPATSGAHGDVAEGALRRLRDQASDHGVDVARHRIDDHDILPGKKSPITRILELFQREQAHRSVADAPSVRLVGSLGLTVEDDRKAGIAPLPRPRARLGRVGRELDDGGSEGGVQSVVD